MFITIVIAFQRHKAQLSGESRSRSLCGAAPTLWNRGFKARVTSATERPSLMISSLPSFTRISPDAPGHNATLLSNNHPTPVQTLRKYVVLAWHGAEPNPNSIASLIVGAHDGARLIEIELHCAAPHRYIHAGHYLLRAAFCS